MDATRPPATRGRRSKPVAPRPQHVQQGPLAFEANDLQRGILAARPPSSEVTQRCAERRILPRRASNSVVIARFIAPKARTGRDTRQQRREERDNAGETLAPEERNR